jgi:hypothetical protein
MKYEEAELLMGFPLGYVTKVLTSAHASAPIGKSFSVFAVMQILKHLHKPEVRDVTRVMRQDTVTQMFKKKKKKPADEAQGDSFSGSN